MAMAAVTRRSFLTTSAALGAAAALPAIGLAAAPQHGMPPAVSDDALRALGERIARDAVEHLDARDHAVSVHYLDCAAPTLSMLREGLAHGFACSGCAIRHWRDACAEAAPVVARLTVQDATSGRTLDLAVDATALSHLALIASATASPVLTKQAILAGDASLFYRVERLG